MAHRMTDMNFSLSLTCAVAFIALLCAAGPIACERSGNADTPKITTESLTVKNEQFKLEVAADTASIEKGLGGRESIPKDGGMLFVFPDSQLRSFWMLDCVIDIDVIFVDSVGGVTAIHRMKADPQLPGESRSAYEGRLKRYSSVSRAQFAIELAAGSIDRLQIKPGDRITADWRQIRRHAR